VAFATRAPSRPTQQGVTVWLTGLPSAGKTTIASPVAERPAERGRAAEGLYARPAPGELPPPQFSRPEVARLLADGYRARRG
jgi:adenylylsulfate kinase-like enzyme